MGFYAPAQLVRDAREHGVQVLKNKGVRLLHRGTPFWLCGVDDLTEGEPDLRLALQGREHGEPAVLMTHHPDYFFEAAALYGVDISPQSIELANRLTLKYSNAFFEVRDLTTDVINRKFDVIVLPDVIEHIPFDLYPSLFSNLNKMMSDNAYIFIHIPHPNYLEWLIHCGSYDLQIIDQPVYTNKLLSIVYPIGFYIHYLSSYSVYSENCDYQVIILKIKSISKRYELKSVPFQLGWYTKLRKRIRYLVRGFK